MQDNQLSIVENIQSLWSANSSEILIIISTVGLDNMVIRVTEYHPSGFTKIYFNTLSLPLSLSYHTYRVATKYSPSLKIFQLYQQQSACRDDICPPTLPPIIDILITFAPI